MQFPALYVTLIASVDYLEHFVFGDWGVLLDLVKNKRETLIHTDTYSPIHSLIHNVIAHSCTRRIHVFIHLLTHAYTHAYTSLLIHSLADLVTH